MNAKLQITTIEDKKDDIPNNEFIRLIAIQDINLRRFAIIDNTFQDDAISNKHCHIYRFPNVEIKANDFVRLYSGEGEYRFYENSKNSTTYEFYWNFEGCIWNNQTGDKATLIEYIIESSFNIPKK